MKLQMPTPPRKFQALAQQATRDISSAALKHRNIHPDEVRKELVAAHPLRIYVLGTLALLDRKDLKAATPVAWRFLILQKKRPVAATEIALKKEDRGPRWARTSYNPRHFRQMETAKRLMSRPEISKENYELRFLRIPGLDLNGLLWLRSSDGSKDRVVQLGKGPMLRAGWPYTIESLLARLRPHAERRRRPLSLAPRSFPPNPDHRSQNDALVQLQSANNVGPASGGGGA
jgi:hypothetical protein